MIDFGKDGRDFTLETRQVLSAPLLTVFPFFADAANLEALTPEFLRFEIRTPKPIDMRVGTLIDYRIRLHGVPIPWRTRITAWEPPHRFVDRQVWGPYLRWIHEHIFEEKNGQTEVIDRVHYRVPFGFIANRMLVRKDLERIFRFRKEKLAERFGQSA